VLFAPRLLCGESTPHATNATDERTTLTLKKACINNLHSRSTKTTTATTSVI
jgi:hypothetical protein